MTEQQEQSSFEIRKLYIKDASLESPHAPGIFLDGTKQPDVAIDVSISTDTLPEDDYFQVLLGITVTSKVDDKTAFLCEVQQGGVFYINNIPEKDLPLALEIAAPNILLPFAREAIADLVSKAGFPPLLLSPMNFESLYAQKHNQKNTDTETSH